MSLAIDVDLVTHVLLADGWHTVANRSFTLDSYEFLWSGRGDKTVAEMNLEWEAGTLYPNGQPVRYRDPMVLHGGGQSGVCAAGFSFREGPSWVSGPLTAILAVRTQAAHAPRASSPSAKGVKA